MGSGGKVSLKLWLLRPVLDLSSSRQQLWRKVECETGKARTSWNSQDIESRMCLRCPQPPWFEWPAPPHPWSRRFGEAGRGFPAGTGGAVGQGAVPPGKGERANQWRCVWTATVPDALTSFQSVETAVALLSFSNLMLSFPGAYSNLEPYREEDSANVFAASL